ncbi:TPA: hypothetical protein N2D78_003472 [Clostridium botulinum]|uniref:hypothetical protein n=1 Tax=Clostridium botulinum TaxID=1491 RepID=UPI000773053D|nr:hypothetical protein [Clostridium botulinum]HCL4466672.1 hypothetical protein [Clostridium botulinum]HCL4470314.1 hypothetical protein [Clostridium botulinum]HCL4485518.1 hypothetical protein [Clostridium botulinum]HCL4496276.1 hypothetical protein [Clostridium botulinum]HCL4499876.1 hypothetical protein [Clostridium botulinum]
MLITNLKKGMKLVYINEEEELYKKYEGCIDNEIYCECCIHFKWEAENCDAICLINNGYIYGDEKECNNFKTM